MRTVIYLILGIIGVVVLIVISVLTKYLEITTGSILISLVLIVGVLIYFLLPKVPKRDYNHEGAIRAQQKEKHKD